MNPFALFLSALALLWAGTALWCWHQRRVIAQYEARSSYCSCGCHSPARNPQALQGVSYAGGVVTMDRRAATEQMKDREADRPLWDEWAKASRRAAGLTALLALCLLPAGCASQSASAVHADHLLQGKAVAACKATSATCAAARSCSAAAVTAARAWREVQAMQSATEPDQMLVQDATTTAQVADANAQKACTAFAGGK